MLHPHSWATAARRLVCAATLLPVLAVTSLAGAPPARSATRGRSPRVFTAHFSATDLGLPAGAEASFATAINASGQVVGYWRAVQTHRPHAFIWDETNGMQDLGELAGDAGSFATDINDAGQVSGGSLNLNGDSHAVMWDGPGSVQDLGSLGGTRSWATGINNANTIHPVQVTGVSLSTNPSNATFRPFLWDAEGGMRDIGRNDPITAGRPTSAWSINGNGQVTGSMPALGNAGIVNHAFIAFEPAGVRDLDAGGSVSTGYSINALGQVAGVTLNGGRQTVLCVWDNAGKHPLLSTLADDSVDLPGTLRAMGMNAEGDVAFTSLNIAGAGSPRRASLFTHSTVLDLNAITTRPAGTTLTGALDINDDGTVVGELVGADGKHHACLLTPAPAPPASADLQVTESTSVPSAQVGQNVTYTVTVKNNGPDRASDVTFTDTLPANGAFVSSTPSGTVASGRFLLDLGPLASGASTTVTVVLRGTAEGTLTNSASVSGPEVDANPDNNSVSADVGINPAPPPTEADLTVTLAATPNPVQTNLPVLFTATVTNHGPDPAATVVLAPAAGGLPLTLITVAQLGANETITRTFTAIPTAAGTFAGNVTVSSDATDPNAADNTASASVTVQTAPTVRKPDLSGQWSAVQLVRHGASTTLTGTLTVTNVGLTPAPATTAALFLSADRTLEDADPALLKGSKAVTLKIPALKSGKGKPVKLSFKLPAGTDPATFTGKFLIASIDPTDRISELSEANNTPASLAIH